MKNLRFCLKRERPNISFDPSGVKRILALLVLLMALALRLYNIYSQNPRLFSETIWVWSRSLVFIPTFSDSYVFYPSLFQIILFVFEWAFFICGYLLGFFNSIIDFDAKRLYDLLMFILLGRFVVVFFSIATIYTVYKVGNKFKDADITSKEIKDEYDED